MKNKKLLASCVGVTMGLLLTGHVMAAKASLNIVNNSNLNLNIGLLSIDGGACTTLDTKYQVGAGESLKVSFDTTEYMGLCVGNGGSTAIRDLCSDSTQYAVVSTSYLIEISPTCYSDGGSATIVSVSAGN